MTQPPRQLAFADIVGYLLPGVLLTLTVLSLFFYDSIVISISNIKDSAIGAALVVLAILCISYVAGFSLSAIVSHILGPLGRNGARTSFHRIFSSIDPLLGDAECLQTEFPSIYKWFKTKLSSHGLPVNKLDDVELSQTIAVFDSFGPDAQYIDRLWVLRNCARNCAAVGAIAACSSGVKIQLLKDATTAEYVVFWLGGAIGIGATLRFREIGRDLVIYKFRNAIAGIVSTESTFQSEADLSL